MNDRDNKEKITEKQYAISMDELGLAEIADDNPLKILHPLLDNLKDIGFIGLSNWVMDVSKMNRVLLISRNELTEADLSEIGRISVSLKVYHDKDKKDLIFEIDETMIQRKNAISGSGLH
jgi:hypothetical protein